VLALKTLARRKIRTALTAVGVATGVATVVALVAVTRGLHGQLNGMFDVGQGYLVVTRKGAADPLISYLPDGLLDGLAATEGVAAAHPLLWGATMVPDNPFFFSFGVDAGSPFLSNVQLVEGRGLFEPANPARSILLDQASGRAVLALLEGLQRERGITLVLVTHDEALAARAGRTVQMVDGRLSELQRP
jgi:hypothetical protein